MARKLTNLAPMMGKIVEGDYGFTLNCYIALPCGITIAYDNLPNDKLGADGKPLYYDATKCECQITIKNKDAQNRMVELKARRIQG